MKKQCTKCKLEKDYSQFFKDKRTNSGLYSACKKCHYKLYLKNLKKWRLNNKDKVKDYRQKNKEYFREYQYKRLKNPKNRLNSNVRYLIWLSLKGRKAGRKWQELVGYTIKDLITHLEQQFDDKMTWENYGSYWWIDHIKPQSLFNYKSAEDEEFKKCWALENLQPLEAIANIRKSNKWS